MWQLTSQSRPNLPRFLCQCPCGGIQVSERDTHFVKNASPLHDLAVADPMATNLTRYRRFQASTFEPICLLPAARPE